MTRLADRASVSKEAWKRARAAFEDRELACLVQLVAAINAFNRINVATGRSAADYAQYRQQTAAVAQAPAGDAA
jgi:alkylhydroperoxidase family enzyme